MSSALYVAVGLLAALVVYSAAMKLSGRPHVVESYARVGVAPERLPVLASLLLVGDAGLVGGLSWAPLGLAAAACLVVYFLLAVVAHARHGDLAHAAVPTVLVVLSAAAAVLYALVLWPIGAG